MPNGKPGDHPLTDTFVHGFHPFPSDIEQMLGKLLRREGYDGVQAISDAECTDWAAGVAIEEGRVKLRRLLDEISY